MEFRDLNSKTKDKDILDSIKCREIIREILDFGVNQGQIKTLIKFLSLELEDRNMMLEIRKIFETSENCDSSGFEEKPSIEI